MTELNNKHENIIKYILLLDKWRSRQAIDEEISALSLAGEKFFPNQTKDALKLVNSLKRDPNFPLIYKLYQPIQKFTIAITLVFVFFIFSYTTKSFAYELANSLIFNPLFILTVFSSFIISGIVMYTYRKKSWDFRSANIEKLQNFKPIIEDLIKDLIPLAIERKFVPKKYPIQLNHNDYIGLRLISSSGSTFHMAFSLSHALLQNSREAQIMTYMGRLSFFDGLPGFTGGKPSIKLIVSQIASGVKPYLKKCADWRMQGVDILVRRCNPDQIKKSYIILDKENVWISDQHLEELDFQDEVLITKLTKHEEKKKIISRFENLWDASQISDELEAISWRSYFKEKKKEERIKGKKE